MFRCNCWFSWPKRNYVFFQFKILHEKKKNQKRSFLIGEVRLENRARSGLRNIALARDAPIGRRTWSMNQWRGHKKLISTNTLNKCALLSTRSFFFFSFPLRSHFPRTFYLYILSFSAQTQLLRNTALTEKTKNTPIYTAISVERRLLQMGKQKYSSARSLQPLFPLH